MEFEDEKSICGICKTNKCIEQEDWCFSCREECESENNVKSKDGDL